MNFETIDENLHYRLIVFGDDSDTLDSSCYLAIDFNYCENSNCPDTSLTKTSYAEVGEYYEFWSRFNTGDEMILILDSGVNATWLNTLDLGRKRIHWPVICRLRIREAYCDGSKQFIDSNLLIFREKSLIGQFLSKAENSAFHKEGKYWSLDMDRGSGDTIVLNSEIRLSYKASFLNGKEFDNTEHWKDSLHFNYGQPMQLIGGLELAIRGRREGAEAKFILPSHLAFGSRGSSSGIVGPFEPLLYHVKIDYVNNTFNENQ